MCCLAPWQRRRTTGNGANSFRPRWPQPGIRRLELAAAKLLHGCNQRAGGVAYLLLKCCVVVEIIVARRVGPHISNISAELRRVAGLDQFHVREPTRDALANVFDAGRIPVHHDRKYPAGEVPRVGPVGELELLGALGDCEW
jgi:hypothetical protein